MSFTTIRLNNNDPNAQPIIDYLSTSSAPLYIHQLEQYKWVVIDFGMICGSSVTALPEHLQNYFLEKDRSTQVIAKADLQVEKVKNSIARYYQSKGKEIQIIPYWSHIDNTKTLLGYEITLITNKLEEKTKKYL